MALAGGDSGPQQVVPGSVIRRNKPKKKKRTNITYTSSSGSVSDATPRGYSSAPQSSPAYHKPVASPAPSYSVIKQPPKPKTPSFAEVMKSFAPPPTKERGLGWLFNQSQQAKPPVEPVGDTGLPEGMQKFLESLRGNDVAPKGYTPGMEKQADNEFAWVPDKFKTMGKNGRLKLYWDQDYIQSALSDLSSPSSVNFFLNGIMEKQYQDREEWLLGKNQRKYDRIKEVLGNASQAAFNGNYDFLEKKLEKNPNLLETETYRSKFGVTPESIWKEWEKQRQGLTLDQREEARYRIDMMMRHYEKLRSGKFFSYRQTDKMVDQAIKKYEDKYNDSVEFALDSSDAAKKAAAKNAGPAIPENDHISNEDQAFIDKVGRDTDPSSRSDAWETFLGPSKKNRKMVHRAVVKLHDKAKKTLGLSELPSVKQMLRFKIANGDLDPNDEAAVEAEIDRLRNPNHPDTRAMYVAFAMSLNPDFDAEKTGLDYINEPVLQYQKDLQKRKASNEKFAFEEDVNNPTGPGDFISDMWKVSKVDKGLSMLDVRAQGGGTGATGTASNPGALDTNQIGWTFDKLLRLNYGVAGMANAWYALDKDHHSSSWTDYLDPIGLVTGQSSLHSVDEVLKDPSKLGGAFDAGYQQVFRGSDLPGIKRDIIPTTFSNVIDNNAMRDPEDNVYDKEWYKHIAGFGLDVAFDPLNLIGVGVIDDTLKVPARIAKELAKSAKESDPATDIVNFLSRIEAPDASPIAEKVFRTDQSIRRLGDDISGKDYADDYDIWTPDRGPINEYDHDATLRSISNQLDDLRIQEIKLKNDLGLESFNDGIRKIADVNASVAYSARSDIRVQRVLQQNATKIAGTDLYNPGGRFWRDFLDPLEKSAKSRGYSVTEYAPTSIGKAAQRAESDLNRLLDDIDEGKLLENSPAVVKKKAELEATIDKAWEIDEATGKPSATNIAKTEEYLDAGAPGHNSFFDPVAALAKAGGISKEDFLKTFSERDVYDAFIKGPRMLTESDEAAAAYFMEGAERIKYAKEQLAQPGITKSKRDAALKAKQIGYTQHSTITVEGALRYLDVLQDMKRGGHLPKNLEVQKKLDHLEGLDSQITEELSKYAEVKGQGEGNYIGSDSMNLKDVPFEGEDYVGKSLEDIIDDPRGFTSTAAKLKSAQADLRAQMDDLRPALAESAEVTGFPPAQAYQVDQMLPETSLFRNKNGEIDTEKVANHLTIDEKTHKVTYTKPENATASDVAFLGVVRDTVQAEYLGAYRAEKTAIVKKNLGDKTTDGPGPRETELGPRPTAENLRKRYPAIFERYVKGEPAGDVPKGFKVEENLEFQGGVKGVPGDYVRKAPKVVETGGKRSKSQKTLDEFISRKQKAWDKEIVRARELDAGEARKVSTKFKVTGKEQELITQRAFKRSVDGVLESLKNGTIKRVPGNMRLTINEQAKQVVQTINLQHKADDIELQLALADAKTPEAVKAIEVKRAALLKQKKDYLAEVEKARKEAHETRKMVSKVVSTEHILQTAAMPPRATGKMLQLRIMGMRKNMQFTHNIFRGAEKAAELVPARMREEFANYFVRPTKQLDTREAIMFRAQWESKTPVIIKANLGQISHAMRDIPEAERTAMMKAYRDGVDYEGPHMQLFDGAMQEIQEIESIWNGTHEFYHFRPSRSSGADDFISLAPYEILKFLPADYQPSMRVLHRMVSEDGAFTADNIIKAIKANGGRVQDLLDPFRFAWTMRLAADQARQLKALKHSIEQTFGVALGSGSRRKVVQKLKQKHGWEGVNGLDSEFIFPPEAMHDIKKLLEITEPGPVQNQISRLMDQGLGYWKQSMTIYNPGYYTRNGVGEMMVSWLDGVNHPKWYRMAYRIHRYSKGEDRNLSALVKKWSVLKDKVPVDEARAGEVLFELKGGLKVRIDDALRSYVNMGLKSTFANTDLGQGLRGLSGSALHDSALRKGMGKINEGVHEAGEGFEDYLRMAHFLHAMQHSNKGTLHQAAMYAAERVRRSHFDYTDFSTFEKSVMVRAFPFYKWTRRGAPLMLAHLFMTPGKMAALPKAMDTMSGLGVDPIGVINDDPVLSTSDVHDDLNGQLPDYQGIAPGWVRDLFAYQVSPSEDDEYGNYFRVQTPQVDGLNAALGFLPGGGNHNPMDIFSDSAAYPLLNPAVKAGVELGTNQSMDPDFPYEVYGGDYNKMNGMNPVESIISYVARSINPGAGFLAKLSKNGSLGPLSMGDGSYREEQGYNDSRDVASFASGLGFYQARPGDKIPPSNDSPVGQYELSDIPEIRGRKAAGDYLSSDRRSRKTPVDGTVDAYGQEDSSNSSSDWVDFPEGKGWVDFPDRKWIDYGNSYGYGGGGSYGYGSSSGPSISSSSGSLSFWDLIQRLKKMIDQGEVYNG